MKIPATVITGFLGSGKTTMIRHLVENNNGRRFALIVDEFGDTGIDRDLLAECGMETCKPGDIVELANGCLCCTVAGDFLPAIAALLNRADPPEHILIETSGLALPKPLIKIFNSPEVKALASVNAVVTLVDCAAVAEGRFAASDRAAASGRAAIPMRDPDSPLEDLFAEQLGAADIIVLTKTDLVDMATLTRVHARVERAARPQARILRAARGRVAPSALLGLGVAAENDLESRPSHHEDHAERDHFDFASMVLTPAGFNNLNQVNRLIRNAIEAHDLLRVKGTLRLEGKPMRLVVQAAGPRLETYFDRPWAEGEEPRLVAIASAGTDWRAVCADLGEPVGAVL